MRTDRKRVQIFCKEVKKLLRRYGCLREYRRRLKGAHGATLWQFVSAVVESPFVPDWVIMTGAFRFPYDDYALWCKISDEWIDYLKKSGYDKDDLCSSGSD